MAASSADFFTKVGNPGTATTLAAPGHTSGGTSITVVSTSNWPTDTGVIFAIDTVSLVNGVEVRDVGSYTEWEGEVTSATAISNMVLRYGSDQNYPAGSTTRVYIPVASSERNRSVDGMLVNHTQTGSHKTLTDGNGNEWLELGTTASAVNHPKVTNAATGNAPLIEAVGGDTNIGLDVSSKGTGGITAWAGAKTRELLKLLNVASAVNEVTISPSATGNPVKIEATGDDTNISTYILAKGTGQVQLGTPVAARAYRNVSQTIQSGAARKISFDAENYDTGANFDITTGTFTAPYTGYYHVTVSATFSNLDALGNSGFAFIYVNGAEWARGRDYIPSANDDPTASVSDLVFITAGQAIEGYCQHDSATANETLAAGSIQTFISIYLVGRTA